MVVTSTEIQNNFGKYLQLAAGEEIVITKNGRAVAKLTALQEQSAAGNEQGRRVAEKVVSYGDGPWKASYEEFLELTKNSEERYEYIDGEIHLLASPKTAHQIVLTELFVIFYHWFAGKKCRPLVAPYDITLRRNPEYINVVQPDLMVICDLEEKLDANDYYQGTPTLLVEIISEHTQRKDLITKLDLYLSCGVEEYWIVNPLNQEITVYQFAGRNIKQSATYRKKEKARSFTFDGLEVELDRVFNRA